MTTKCLGRAAARGMGDISVLARWAVLLILLTATAALPAWADDFAFAQSDVNGISAPVYLTLNLSNGTILYLSTATGAVNGGSQNQGWWTEGCCTVAPGIPSANYFVGTSAGTEYRDYFSFTSLPVLTTGVTVSGATLNLLNFTGSNTAFGFVLSGVDLSPNQLSTINGTDPLNYPPTYFVQLGAGQTNPALYYGGAVITDSGTATFPNNPDDLTTCNHWASSSDTTGTPAECYSTVALNTTGLTALQNAINSGSSFFTIGGSAVGPNDLPLPPSPPDGQVPEPASILLVVSGLAAVAGRQWRSKPSGRI